MIMTAKVLIIKEIVKYLFYGFHMDFFMDWTYEKLMPDEFAYEFAYDFDMILTCCFRCLRIS